MDHVMSPQFHNRFRHRRRGILLIELLVAALVIGVLVGGLVPVVRALGRQRRLVAQQGLALAEATALLQQARGQGREGLPAEPRPDLLAVLPGAAIRYATPPRNANDGLPAGEWLQVTIEWTPTAESRRHHVTQTAWIAGKAAN